MTAAISVCMALTGVHNAQSCSVPVFRYALERWTPDAYKGIVIFKGEMTESEQVLFDQLKNSARNPDFPLNLDLQAVQTSSMPKMKLEEVLKGGVPEKLPVIAVWYPDKIGKEAPFFFEALTPDVVQTIIHSPKREALAKRLIDKDAAVWIFLPSGEKETDQQAEAFVKKELDAAEARLAKMPKPEIPGREGQILSYEFSVLHIEPSDPREDFFLEMLLGTESDLYENQDKPMIFPVFGRGRLLGALFGEYVTTDNIQGAVSFMTGACSCEVKAMNPGTDLLMAAPWERAVLDLYAAGEPMPELTGVMPDEPGSDKQVSGEPGEVQNGVNLLLVYGLALIGLLGAVGLLSMVLLHRSGRNR